MCPVQTVTYVSGRSKRNLHHLRKRPILKINLGDKPLNQTEPSPAFFIHPGDLLAAVAARPDWTRTTSLVETITMLHAPKFSSHAVFADHRKNLWARTFTRFISITGWSPTTTAAFSRTMIYNGRAAAGMNCPLRVRARLRLGQNVCASPSRSVPRSLQAFQPPSTVRLSPLMKAESGFARKDTAEATSSAPRSGQRS